MNYIHLSLPQETRSTLSKSRSAACN